MVAKAVALVREVLLAALFGTSLHVAAYRAASTATLLPVSVLATDALNAGFLPLYKKRQLDGLEEARAFFWVTGLLLLATSVVLSALLFFGADAWCRLLVPGFDQGTLRVTARFLRIMALGLPFAVVSALLTYVEMANGRYWLVSMRAAMQSTIVIAATGAAFLWSSPSLLAWGFTASFLVLSAVGAIAACRARTIGLPSLTVLRTSGRTIADFLRSVGPALVVPPLVQCTLLIERAIASMAGIGAVAALDYAKAITDTGLAMIAIPIGLASLGELTGFAEAAIRQRLERLLPLLLVVLIPVSAFLAGHSQVIVEILYARGAFADESVQVTSTILFGLCIGFWAQVVGYVLMKILTAQRRNRDVLWVTSIALSATVATLWLLMPVLGPVALGLAWSAYGVVLVILGSVRLGVFESVVRYAGALVPGIAAYGLLVPIGLRTPISAMLGALGLFLVFWSLYFVMIPRLRVTVRDALLLLSENRRVHR